MEKISKIKADERELRLGEIRISELEVFFQESQERDYQTGHGFKVIKRPYILRAYQDKRTPRCLHIHTIAS